MLILFTDTLKGAPTSLLIALYSTLGCVGKPKLGELRKPERGREIEGGGGVKIKRGSKRGWRQTEIRKRDRRLDRSGETSTTTYQKVD